MALMLLIGIVLALLNGATTLAIILTVIFMVLFCID